MGIVSAMMQVGAAIKHAVAALFKVTHSLRFDGSGDYLLSAPISASDDTTFTVSAWVKMDDVTGGVNSILSGIYVAGTANHQIIFSTDGDEVRYFQFTNGNYTSDIKTSNSPISAGVWHHVVFQIDTTASLPDDRVKIWVDGTPQTNFATQTTYSQNAQTLMSNGTWPSTLVHQQLTVGGAYSTGNTTFYYKFGGLIAELHFIDGQALSASDFGETRDGQWVPKEVTGVTYGNNGFYLPFSAPSSEVNAFNSVLWTADGTTAIDIEGVGFQPDLVWMKARNQAYNHHLHDAVRGTNKWLQTNLTNGEDTANTNSLTSYNSDGFTLGTGSNGNYSGTGGTTHVAWCWKAGGAPTSSNSATNGSAMVDGVATTTASIASAASASITPTKMSVNTGAGFSIVQYTGTGSAATIPHGLNSAPDVIIIKDTSAAQTSDQWPVFHSATGATGDLVYLHKSSAGIPAQTVWNNTNPTSDVFSVGTWGGINYTGDDFIAYCWHSVPGFSKFGSYSGSGGAGNKVTTGFKPAFVMIKSTGSNNWVIIDNKRSPVNYADKILYPDEAWVEATGSTTTSINFLADGFDFGGGGGSINSSGSHSYIYMAFADTSPNLGLDTTTNSNNFTVNGGITPDDQLIDSPNLRFASFDPDTITSSITLSEANLVPTTSSTGDVTVRVNATNFAKSSGKYYFEACYTGTVTTGQGYESGWVATSLAVSTGRPATTSSGYALGTGSPYYTFNNNTVTNQTSLGNVSTNSVARIAVDLDDGKMWIGVDATWIGDPAAGTGNTFSWSPATEMVPYCTPYQSGREQTFNFGQDHTFAGSLSPLTSPYTDDDGNGEFYYEPPSGFKALATSY